MAKYGGSWAKGFAKSFDPLGGINLGLQWKEKKKAQKKIDDEVEQLKINSMELAAMYDKARADGTITQQEYGDAMAWALPLGKEIMGRTNDLYTNYQDMTPDQLQTELDNIDAMFNFSKELDFTNLEQMKAFGNKLTQPNAKMQWDLVVKSIEGRGKPMQPEVFPSLEAARAKYPEAKIEFNTQAGGYVVEAGEVKPTASAELSAKDNWAIENYKAGKISFNELSKYMGTYIAPEEMSAKEKEIELAKQYGATNEEIKNKLLGKTTPTPTPEGEVTAGEKRTWDMASSVLFGSSDWVTGISKPGIISTMISNKLNMGQTLTDEEKTEVRNNYNTIKGTLPGEVTSAVESQLQRYGIPLVEPTKTITPTPTPEPEPKKWWEFWKGETTPTTPEVTPKVGEIPTPKVSPGAKEAMIPMMTKEELHKAMLDTDRSDPLWDLLYKEAVKRGYITE